MTTVSVGLSATVVPFKAQMAEAARAVKSFGAEVQAAAVRGDQGAHQIGLALAGIGAAAVAAAAAGVKMAADLEASMRNVATISDQVRDHFGAATDQILELSTRLPQSADQLAQGLYDIASSGFQGGAGMAVLTASASAASAGLTDTATAARAITGVLNAYGLTAADATDVSDVMFQVVNKGVITFAELAQNMGDIAPIAPAAGIGFDEAGAALAAMTLSGLPAAEAATSLSGVIRGLIDPSLAMTAQLQAMGYETGTQAVEALGLKGVLEGLNVATRGNADAWIALFPDIRAARGAMAATANDGKNLAAVSASITDENARQGSTAAALAEQQKSLNAQMKLLHNEVSRLAIEFGQALLPALTVVAGAAADLIDGFEALPGPVKVAAGVVGVLGGAVTVAGGAFLLLGPRIAAARAMIVGITETSTVAAGAFGLVQSAIGPIGLALTIATPLLAAFGSQQRDAKTYVDALKASLDEQTGAITTNTAAAVAKRVTDKGLDEDAGNLGISLDTLTQAMLGNADAQAKVRGVTGLTAKEVYDSLDPVKQAALEHYNFGEAQNRVAGAVKGAASALSAAKDQRERDKAATDAATQALGGNTAAVGANAASLGGATPVVDAHAEAMKKVSDLIGQLADPLNAYREATQAAAEAQQKASDATIEAIGRQYDAKKELLTQEERAEKDALDRMTQARKDALEEQLKEERDAIDEEHQMFLGAIEARYDAEREALEGQSRAEKEALDDRQRTEKQALDVRLRQLDQEADKRKKAENRAFEAQKDNIQFQIDSTFGEEREGWKARLVELEDAHGDRLDAIDTQVDAEKTTERNGLDDRQRTEKDSLDDRLGHLKDNIVVREDAEKTAETTRYDNATAAWTARATQQKTALDNEVTDLQNHLTDKYNRLDANLKAQETAASEAEKTRATNAKAAQGVELGDYQTFLNDKLRAADEFNNNLAIIASRGGADVYAEVAKLPPEIVAQAAKAGPAALTALLESIRVSLVTRDPTATIIAPSGQPWVHSGAGPALAVPPRAGGGPIDGLAWVGERGPELIAARGTVIPADVSAGLARWARSANAGVPAGAGGGGGVSITVMVQVENHLAPGIDLGVAGRIIREETERAVTGALGQVGYKVTARGGRS